MFMLCYFFQNKSNGKLYVRIFVMTVALNKGDFKINDLHFNAEASNVTETN